MEYTADAGFESRLEPWRSPTLANAMCNYSGLEKG
jgi:hypothetical protein